MGTKLLLGFGGTVIQVVVHPVIFAAKTAPGFGCTANQAVVHLKAKVEPVRDGFGCTINQAVVHPIRGKPSTVPVSEVR